MKTETKTNGTTKMMNEWAENTKKTIENLTKSTENMNKEFFGAFSGNTSNPFQSWFEGQKNFFESFGNKKETKSEDYFTNWYNQQMEMGKKMMGQTQQFFNNPMHFNWQDAMNPAQNFWTNAMQDAFKNMSNGEQMEYIKTMFNNADTYTKMFQIWQPILKSLQEGNFKPEMVQEMMQPEKVKEMMDNFMNMMPNEYKSFTNYWNETMKNFQSENGERAQRMYNQMKDGFNSNFAPMMQFPFNQWMNLYNGMSQQMQFASNPFMTMLTPDANKESLETLREINDKMVQFNVRNAQMQFLMYEKGNEAMQAFGEGLYNKMQAGESFESFMKFYTEFLNTMDSHMVALFSSENFSKVQSEMSSLGFRLKKQMEEQMEKSLANLPVVTRSEMDKLYESVYEMNKNLREMMRGAKVNTSKNTSESNTKTTPKAAAKKAPVKKSVAKKATARKK